MPDEPETRAMNLELAVRADEDLDVLAAKTDVLAMDESAFRIFHEQTARPLLAYLVRACGDRHLAEDIRQEAYCRFLTVRVPSMDERQARSYLFQIATNLMRDKWRRRKEEPIEDDTPEPVSPAPNHDAELGIRQAFERLKPRERQLLWLAYVEGSNHKEIAACTGLRAASIRLLLFRARRKLADLLRAESRPRNCEVTKWNVNK
jgi:RNA polymerase sigma-70 factor, ECF subfamily